MTKLHEGNCRFKKVISSNDDFFDEIVICGAKPEISECNNCILTFERTFDRINVSTEEVKNGCKTTTNYI